jgi:uncharacterized iron-regulated protein
MLRPPFLALPLLALLFAGACAPAATTAPSPAPGPDATPAPPPPVEGTDFVVYRADGTPASLAGLVAAMAGADAVLVGEEHDDAVTHRVQRVLLERAFVEYGGGGGSSLPEGHPPVASGEGRAVLLSLEMFERDVQYIVDEYLEGLISESHFRASARPWDNYEADYRPMVEFARVHGLPVVAANAPRRYVNRASRLGRESLDELPARARRHLPPLPYPEATDAYREQWDALMGEAARHMQGSPLDGQTLWDAAMGHAVARALDEMQGALVLHMAGGFHVERDTGIPDAVRHYRPWTRILSVAARPVADPSTFDPERHTGLGDFVILTRATDPPGP